MITETLAARLRGAASMIEFSRSDSGKIRGDNRSDLQANQRPPALSLAVEGQSAIPGSGDRL